jgi:hypothetical protein
LHWRRYDVRIEGEAIVESGSSRKSHEGVRHDEGLQRNGTPNQQLDIGSGNDMTLAELVRGPNQIDGPAPGMWHVTGRPDAGITPKFTIKDARGDTYLIKLDPAKFPELPSSVEVISTKIFHAIGYHVPEDFIVTFDLSRLDVAPGAQITTLSGKKRLIEKEDLAQWLKNTPRTKDGSIRALASRYVPGKVVGQYRYTGTRPDDPNDIYPHERRRELRRLRVFAAWLNHDDARSINSIDTYVEEDGRHYIRHYLQDFGSNLGSGSTSAQQPRGGNEYLIERDKIGKDLISFGLNPARLDESQISDQSGARQHRSRLLRATEVEDRISAAGIRRDGRSRRVLGCQDCLAFQRRHDQGHRRHG